jgi:hypothetical protein
MQKNLHQHADDQHFDERFLASGPMPGLGQQQVSSNPLARYFRVPGVHVKLPTKGAFMPPGSIEFTMSGEVPVYPMRGADEILLKSPDALMNGYAIEKLLESCVPAIRTPRLISSPDLDVLLMAIRAATYGEMIELSPTCPSCQTVNEVAHSLSAILSTMVAIDAENAVRLSDEVVAYIRPHNLEDATRLGLASFEEARKVQVYDEPDADQVARARQIGQSMGRLAELTNDTSASCIVKVIVPGGEVRDRGSIREFISNIPKPWTDAISKALEEINRKGIDKHFPVKCHRCSHEWQSEVEFNPSTFFEPGSLAS